MRKNLLSLSEANEIIKENNFAQDQLKKIASPKLKINRFTNRIKKGVNISKIFTEFKKNSNVNAEPEIMLVYASKVFDSLDLNADKSQCSSLLREVLTYYEAIKKKYPNSVIDEYQNLFEGIIKEAQFKELVNNDFSKELVEENYAPREELFDSFIGQSATTSDKNLNKAPEDISQKFDDEEIVFDSFVGQSATISDKSLTKDQTDIEQLFVELSQENINIIEKRTAVEQKIAKNQDIQANINKIKNNDLNLDNYYNYNFIGDTKLPPEESLIIASKVMANMPDQQKIEEMKKSAYFRKFDNYTFVERALSHYVLIDKVSRDLYTSYLQSMLEQANEKGLMTDKNKIDIKGYVKNGLMPIDALKWAKIEQSKEQVINSNVEIKKTQASIKNDMQETNIKNNKQLLDANVKALKTLVSKLPEKPITNGTIVKKGTLFKQQAIVDLGNLNASNEVSDITIILTSTIEKLTLARDFERGINIQLFNTVGEELKFDHTTNIDQTTHMFMLRDTRAADEFINQNKVTNTEPLQNLLNNARGAIELYATKSAVSKKLKNTQFNEKIIQLVQANAGLLLKKKTPIDIKSAINQMYAVYKEALNIEIDNKTIQNDFMFASNVSSLKNNQYHIASAYKVENRTRSYDVLETDTLMLGTSDNLKEIYTEVSKANGAKVNKENSKFKWYNTLSIEKRKMVSNNIDKLIDGKGMLNNAMLGVIPGLRNCMQKDVYVDGKHSGKMLHMGSPANVDAKHVSKTRNKVRITGIYRQGADQKILNDLQKDAFETFIDEDQKVVISNLVSPGNRYADYDQAVYQGSKYIAKQSDKIEHTVRSYNIFRNLSISPDEGTSFKNNIKKPLAKKLQEVSKDVMDPKTKRDIKSLVNYLKYGALPLFRTHSQMIKKAESIGKITAYNYNSSNYDVTDQKPQHDYSDLAKFTQLIAETERERASQKSILKLFSKTNDVNDIAAKEGLIYSMAKDAIGVDLIQEYNCKSGKDRTGMVSASFVVEAIAASVGSHGKEEKQSIAKGVVKAGQTQRLASLNGGTRGCEGVKPSTAKRAGSNLINEIDNISSPTANLNKIKMVEVEIKNLNDQIDKFNEINFNKAKELQKAVQLASPNVEIKQGHAKRVPQSKNIESTRSK